MPKGCLTNRASAAGARFAGAPCARSFYATRQAHKRNSSLLGRARQLQALVRRFAADEVRGGDVGGQAPTRAALR